MKTKINIKKMVIVAILGAMSTVVMLLEFPLFFAPPFYKLDLSEIIVLIGAFGLGPVAGAGIEFIKIMLNLLINNTITAYVGEAANFIMGCSFIIPAAMIYRYYKSRKGAVIGMIIGTIALGIVGSLINYYVLLPLYAKLMFENNINAIVGIGTKVNKNITDLKSFIIFAVLPFNVLKGIICSAAAFVLYKRLSPILHRFSK
ncbi:MAG: ECF transporter S component [Oscillospiraceae bacterium]|jgi:riboflavin transporter FmnP